MPEIEIRVQNKKATLKAKQQESIICCNIDIGVYVDGGIRTSTPLQLTCEKSILCE